MVREPPDEELGRETASLDRALRQQDPAEGTLLDSDKRYRNLFNESRDAIYFTSREGKFLDANKALLELFGYTREALVGKLYVQEIYRCPEERDDFQKEIERKGSVRDYPVKFRSKTGTEMDCLLTSTVRRSEGGRILGYQGIIRDVTRQKKAEEALRESEALYRAMVEAFDGLIYICSQDFRVEFMNQRFIERTGYDATGELCYKALHNLDSICPWCVNERVFKGEIIRWEILSPKDNRWLYTVNTPIYHADGSMSKQAMILDITDRKRMEDALKESSEKTKLFAYSVSHDLKNPAIAIYGLTKLLYKHYGTILEEKGKNYCRQIMETAEQIVALVEKINVFISTKEAPLTVQRLSPEEIFQMVREEFSSQLDVRQIRWSVPECISEMNADRLSLLRAFRNLVDNALKYGGDNLREISIGYEESEQHHIFSVKDDGVGLKTEDAKKIFRAFMRKETSKGVEGTGLGLAIVKEIAERHNGEVWAKPGPEKGITFYISISKCLQISQ